MRAWRAKVGGFVPCTLAAIAIAAFAQATVGGLAVMGGLDAARGWHAAGAIAVELLVDALVVIAAVGGHRSGLVSGLVLFFLAAAQHAFLEDDTWLRGLHVGNGLLLAVLPLVVVLRRPSPRPAQA